MRCSIKDTLTITIKPPRGFEYYWNIIRELDKNGPWTIREVSDQTNALYQATSDYISRLQKSNFVEQVGKRETSVKNVYVNLYKLLKSPRNYPRIRRDGTELPEPINERLWRTMKMAKRFTADELVALASDDLITVKLATAKNYIFHLNKAGILQTVVKGNSKNQSSYMFVDNLGAAAPKVLKCHSVYDPNTHKILCETEIKEVCV